MAGKTLTRDALPPKPEEPEKPVVEERPLTVAEVIAVLQKLPQHLPVWSEGCDCYGDVVSAKTMTLPGSSPSEEVVILMRSTIHG